MAREKESANGSSAKPKKLAAIKPCRALPTNRIAFPKQLDILRAFGAASEPDGRPVNNGDVASIVGLTAGTVSIINGFFLDLQLLQRTGDGICPSSEVLEYNRTSAWNAETAPQQLAPAIARSWFAQALMPKLRFKAISEEEAIQTLASAATAGPEYRSQIETLLDYLRVCGIVARENGQVRLSQQQQNGQESTRTEQNTTTATTADPCPLPTRATTITTQFSPSPTAGIVQFNISAKVDMQELATWSPDRIAAFFAGIAQVLAAKKGVEEVANAQ